MGGGQSLKKIKEKYKKKRKKLKNRSHFLFSKKKAGTFQKKSRQVFVEKTQKNKKRQFFGEKKREASRTSMIIIEKIRIIKGTYYPGQ